MYRVETGSKVPVSRPAVSVVIPAYASAGFIRKTVDSVFSQDHPDYELILVSDDPSDAAALKGTLGRDLDRIVFIDKEVNSGVSAARNLGGAHARADEIAFLDADDVWFENYLTDLLDFKTRGGYDVAYADAKIVGAVTGPQNYLSINPPEGELTRERMISGRCHILPSGTIISKRVFDAMGGFDEAMVRSEDFDLMVRCMAAGYRFGYRKKVLLRYLVRPGGLSGNTVEHLHGCIAGWERLKRDLDFSSTELATIDGHIANAGLAITRAEGRSALYRRDWDEAKNRFAEALDKADKMGLPLAHRVKLRAVVAGLSLWPELVRSLAGRADHTAQN